MPITNNDWRPISSHPEFQQKLIDDKIFSNKSYIFGISLALGFMLKRRSVEQPTHKDGGFARIMPIYQRGAESGKFPLFLDLANFIFDHYAEGDTEKERLKDMDKIAEGGLEFLMEQNEQQGLKELDITQIIQIIRDLDNTQSTSAT